MAGVPIELFTTGRPLGNQVVNRMEGADLKFVCDVFPFNKAQQGSFIRVFQHRLHHLHHVPIEMGDTMRQGKAVGSHQTKIGPDLRELTDDGSPCADVTIA